MVVVEFRVTLVLAKLIPHVANPFPFALVPFHIHHLVASFVHPATPLTLESSSETSDVYWVLILATQEKDSAKKKRNFVAFLYHVGMYVCTYIQLRLYPSLTQSHGHRDPTKDSKFTFILPFLPDATP